MKEKLHTAATFIALPLIFTFMIPWAVGMFGMLISARLGLWSKEERRLLFLAMADRTQFNARKVVVG